MNVSEWIWLLGFLLVPQIVGGIGAVATIQEIPGWYRDLRKPSWNPPGWIFGPVWTALYLMMGFAGWLCWREVGFSGSWAWWFGAQLVLNGFWSWLFFRWKKLDLAFGEILLLFGVILACLVVFWPISVWAGVLMVPYLVWVGFASFLNLTIWRLNR